ncbi:MAG TPA: phosphatase PAP2 family protein [Gaiellaceae bacterium]|jgi:undecaprenyl-diphosphatase|nr:phosphatase PAP2 family protein [Gaiellaceae bacterium]
MAAAAVPRNDLELQAAPRAAREGTGPGAAAPVLDGESSPTALLARLTGETHPVRAFLAGVVLAYVAIAAVSILLGLLVTRVIVTNGWLARDDEFLVRVLAHHRSGGLTEASLIGSIIAGGVTLPILVAAFGLVAAAFRQWRLAAFLIFALAVESAAYRTTTLVVHRHRPKVVRLEHLPVNASYPSGHTAAAIAVYCGLALLVTSRVASRWARVAIWMVAVAVPVFVALSRMYRGMHHPLDVAGGVVIGVAALVAMVLVSRAAGIAAAARDRERAAGRFS